MIGNSSTQETTRQTTAILLGNVNSLVDQARSQTARKITSIITMLYWDIGAHIKRQLAQQADTKAELITVALAQQLTLHFGQAFNEKNLRQMIQFVELFPDESVVARLSAQLGWSHFVEILPLKQALEREFYTEICRVERWNVQTLHEQISSQLYSRTIANTPSEALILAEIKHLHPSGQTTPDMVFRDPYTLDFLGLGTSYNERDMKANIVRELELFLLASGTGFTFVERHKPLSPEQAECYLDLLFYHRHLRRLIAVDLKLEPLQDEDKALMVRQLHWLNKYHRAQAENAPIGLLLSASANAASIELIDFESPPVPPAEYLRYIPELALLQAHMQHTIALMHERAVRTHH